MSYFTPAIILLSQLNLVYSFEIYHIFCPEVFSVIARGQPDLFGALRNFTNPTATLKTQGFKIEYVL